MAGARLGGGRRRGRIGRGSRQSGQDEALQELVPDESGDAARVESLCKKQQGRRHGAATVAGGKRRCRSGSAVNPSSTLPAVKHMLQVLTSDQSKGAPVQRYCCVLLGAYMGNDCTYMELTTLMVRSSSPKSYLPLCLFH